MKANAEETMYGDLTRSGSATIPTSPQRDPSPQPRTERLNAWLIYARVARLPFLAALTMPVLWGTALAWWQLGTVNWLLCGFLVMVSLILGLSLSLLDYYQDYQQTLKLEKSPDRGPGIRRALDDLLDASPRMDGYHCLRNGLIRAGTVRSFAYIALVIAVFAIVWIGLLGGWPLWFFLSAALGLVLLFLIPPIRYSNRWWMVEDVGLLFGLGILPALSAFYAQTQTVSLTVLAASLTPAVLAWLSFKAHSLYSWRRDWKLHKRTAVVALGPQRALDVATTLGLLAFIATLLLVAFDHLPVWSLLVLGALPTFLRAFARGHHPVIERSEALQAVDLSAVAALLAGLLLIGAFWIA